MFLSKYAVARHIYIPIIKRGVVDFAVGADWTPSAGDVKISTDGGAATNVTNLPTAITMGNGAMWDFSLTSGEITGKQMVVTVVDAATKAVEDQSFVIETYGNASAQHVFDLGTAALTAATIATSIWQDTTAGDFTAALSIGKSVMNGVALGTGLTVNDITTKTGYALTSGERNSIADATLDRDMSTGTDSGSTTVRTMRQALRFLRNKWTVITNTLTVYKEDDSTTSWTSTTTPTVGADPITGSDPAGP